MPDDDLSTFIDRVLVHLRSSLETDLHAFTQDFRQQASMRQAAAVEDAVAAARRETEEARGELDRLQRSLGDATRAAEAAQHERAAVQHSLDEMRHAATLASETLSGVAARTQQIVDGVRAIDAAGSVGEVLERLAQAVKGYAQRSVLLMVRGSSLTAWRAGDFPAIAGTTLPVDASGLIAHAVQRRQPLVRLDGTPDSEGALPPFAADGRARDAMAVPIVLGGEAVAVLYADAPRGADTVDRRWPLALEVVTRYAGRVIEAMTLKQSIGLPVAAHASPQPRGSETAS